MISLKPLADLIDTLAERNSRGLYYFEEILPFEFAAISRRRKHMAEKDPHWPRGGPVAPSASRATRKTDNPHETGESRRRSPDPARLFADVNMLAASGGDRLDGDRALDGGEAAERAREPDPVRTRPRPVPCDATGLAFSGGGIRSAAVCLGAIQALDANRRLPSIDYLSTVSGGGYMGACLSAALSDKGGAEYPFAADVADSPAVAHLRNYSNYLMPRGRSGLRNGADAAAVVLRGLLANAIITLSLLMACTLLTILAYAGRNVDWSGSPILALANAALGLVGLPQLLDDDPPFRLTLWFLGAAAIALIVWALLRSDPKNDEIASDTGGRVLPVARTLLIGILVCAAIELQPRAIAATARFLADIPDLRNWFATLVGGALAFAGTIASFASTIGEFLETSRRASGLMTLFKRGMAKLALLLAGLVLPLALWGTYLWLSARAIEGWPPSPLDRFVTQRWPDPPVDNAGIITLAYGIVFAFSFAISFALRPNAYSLHRFYRDRLSRAFLFGRPTAGQRDPESLDTIKLSELAGSNGPYHIINTALNVQGSVEANRRGRDADFFMFSSEFVGSDLTLFARTAASGPKAIAMETIDPRLDLGTAMATSGAAVSANMGSNTVRILSPTLALLNVRLGYWLPNPRSVALRGLAAASVYSAYRRLREKLYLFAEILNWHDECSDEVYLTDGGHIENLGLYELLKRGCQLIVVIDAEADPDMSFASLLRVQRYARIDLGVRIVLPWEQIADAAQEAGTAIAAGKRLCLEGPHAAVGRILYEDGNEGVLLYFKSSVTGDEKDYVLDYKKRNPAFPHETTGDQFFSEEQFEMYRALGFHMVDGVFRGADKFAFLTREKGGFANMREALSRVEALLPPHGAGDG